MSLRRAFAQADAGQTGLLSPPAFSGALASWAPSLGGGAHGGAALLASAILGDDTAPVEWGDFASALEQLARG